ncbi:hypothetical protein PYCC9005_000541 [Savitreella phatthalungensis]
MPGPQAPLNKDDRDGEGAVARMPPVNRAKTPPLMVNTVASAPAPAAADVFGALHPPAAALAKPPLVNDPSKTVDQPAARTTATTTTTIVDTLTLAAQGPSAEPFLNSQVANIKHTRSADQSLPILQSALAPGITYAAGPSISSMPSLSRSTNDQRSSSPIPATIAPALGGSVASAGTVKSSSTASTSDVQTAASSSFQTLPSSAKNSRPAVTPAAAAGSLAQPASVSEGGAKAEASRGTPPAVAIIVGIAGAVFLGMLVIAFVKARAKRKMTLEQQSAGTSAFGLRRGSSSTKSSVYTIDLEKPSSVLDRPLPTTPPIVASNTPSKPAPGWQTLRFSSVAPSQVPQTLAQRSDIPSEFLFRSFGRRTRNEANRPASAQRATILADDSISQVLGRMEIEAEQEQEQQHKPEHQRHRQQDQQRPTRVIGNGHRWWSSRK